jgi:hypothetical protein
MGYCTSFSQSVISGVLTDNTSKFEFPVVQLFKKHNGDSLLIKSSIPDSLGNYSFNTVSLGTYIVRFSSIQYNFFYTGYIIVRQNNSVITLDTIDLSKKIFITNLKEVVVKADRPPLFEQQREKLIFNIESSIINIGANGLEALQKIPGIFVDQNDNIFINGQTGVQIRINGRLLNLNQTDIAQLLKNLDVGLIKKIELSVVPGSSNDASGSSGVVNIVLKKNINLGLNGNIGFTHRQSGSFARDNTNLSLNYLSQKWNIYNTFSFSSRTTFDSIDINRLITKVDTLIFQKTYNKYPFNTLGLNSGIIYKLNDKNDLSLNLNGSSTNGKTNGINQSYIYKNALPLPPPSSFTEANNFYTNKYNYGAANLNYTCHPDTLGTEFSLNIDYATYNQNSNQFSDIFENRNGIPDTYQRRGEIPNKIYLKSADVQGFYHYDTSLILKGGLKFTNSRTINNATYWLTKDNIITLEKDKIASFNYEESIVAGFFEIEKGFKRNSVIAGIRIENTNFNGITILPADTSIRYNRTDYFPFLYVDQKISKNQLVSLTYSRRIDRPSFQDLNPYLVYYDPYTYTSGNPKLIPEFTEKVEFTYNLAKLPLLKILYSETKNAITSVTYQNDSTLTTYKTVDNLALKKLWNISTIIPIRIKNKFLSINYFALGKTFYKGFYESAPISISRNSFTYYNNTTFSFKNGLAIEAGGFYNKGMLYGLFEIGEIWAFNCGIQKSFFAKKLNLKINFTDIFRSQINQFSFVQSNINLFARQYSDTRAVGISLVYKFGIVIKGINKNSSSIDEEKARVKQAEH